MNDSSQPVPQITFRIPGAWSDPGELLQRLPKGFRLTPDSLSLPDGTSVDFIPMPADRQFPRIFESSCRRPPSQEELATVARYSVNVGLCGAGGSLKAARRMMEAGAAIVEAGGAGVFIDNSALAHGGADWLELTEDGTADAISFAFTAIIRGEREIYTLGMHAMGFPDLLINAADVDEQGDALIEIVRYVCGGEKPVGVGHIFIDAVGPRFQVVAQLSGEFDAESPMHNPFGRLKIAPFTDVAERN
jgi:hypothetical protein